MDAMLVRSGLPICRADALQEAESLKFRLVSNGREAEGFLIRFRGRYFAWVNTCAHLALALDLDDNDFFTPDLRYLVCKTHAAIYEPDTGLCVSGPCLGKALERIPVIVTGEHVLLAAPDP